MWSSWYAPAMWKLWARSSDDQFLSRLRTTMMTENHWKQLKYHHLGFMHRPRLDETIHIMITDVVPAAIIASELLEGNGRAGAAPQLTTYQRELKKSWKTLSQRPLGNKDYGTNIQRWTCRCGAQQFQAQHLCKHLVQSVNISPVFFTELNRRRTMPLYEHAILGNSIPDTLGSTSAGDDFLWMGRPGDLSSGKWRSMVPGLLSGFAGTSRRSRSPSLEYGPSQNKKASFFSKYLFKSTS